METKLILAFKNNESLVGGRFSSFSSLVPLRKFAGSFLILSIVFLAVLINPMVDAAHAAIRTSTATGGNWGVGGTWVGGVAPAAADDAIIATGATVTLTANSSITNLTIQTGATLANAGFTLTVTGINYTNNGTHSGTGGTTLSGAATLSGTGSITNTGTFTLSTGAKTIASTANLTFAGPVTVTGITATNNGTVSVTGVLGGTGGWTNAANSTLNLKASPTITTLTASAVPNTVNYDGTAAQTVRGTTYNILKSNNTAGATLGAAATVTTLTIGDVTAGSIFSDGGFVITPAGGSALNLTSGTYNLGSATVGTAFPAYGAINFSTGTTVGYTSGVAQVVSTTPAYKNLTISGAGIKTTAAGTLTIGENWDVTGTGAPAVTLLTNNTVVNVTGNITGTGAITQGTGAINIAGNWTHTGTFTNGGAAAVVNYNGTAAQTARTAATTYGTLTINNTAGVTLLAVPTVTNLKIGDVTPNSVLNSSTFSIVGNAGGTMTMSAGSILYLGETATATATTFPTTFTTANIALNPTSTVVYRANANQTISGAPAYGNLTLLTGATSVAKTAGAALTVNGNFTLDAAPVQFNAGNSFTHAIKGNWTNNSTHATPITWTTANTITLAGTTQQTLSGKMTGTSRFNNLIITNNSGADPDSSPSVIFASNAETTGTVTVTTASVKVRFQAGGTYTFTNISFNGAATTTRVQLRSSAPGTRWNLAVMGTQNVLNTDAKDSDASSGNTILASTANGNLDSGNNLNWFFGASCTTALTGNWNAAATWNAPCNVAGGPTAADYAVVQTGHVVTLTAPAAAYAISFNNPVAANGITIGANTLTVTGSVVFSASTSVNPSTLNVGTGALNAGAITINGGTVAGGNSIVTISTGTVNVTGPVTFLGTAAQARLTFTGAGALNVGGNFTSGGTLTTVAGSVINFNGTAAQTAGLYTTYNVFKVNNPAGVTLTGAITVVSLRIGDVTPNSVLNSRNFNITGNATGPMSMSAGSILYLGDTAIATGTTFPTNFTTANIALNSTSTVVYRANAAQTVSGAPQYGNLTLLTGAAATTKTLGAAGTVNGDLTINSRATFAQAALALTIAGNYTNNGTHSGTVGPTMSGVAKTLDGTGSITNTGTFTLTNNKTVLSSANLTFAGLISISAATAVTNDGTITVNNTGANPLTGINATTSAWTQGAGSTLNYRGTTLMPTGIFDASTNTPNAVNYTNIIAIQTVKAITYSNLGIDKTTWTATLAAATVVKGNLTISSGILATGNFALTIGGNYTNNGTFTVGTATVTLDGNANTTQQTLSGTMTGTSAFSTLVITNNYGADPDSSPSVIFASNMTTGTLTVTTANVKLRFNAGGTYTVSTNFTLNGQATASRVRLRSSAPGTRWNLAATAATRSVLNTDVRDSDATTSGAAINASDVSNFDSGNNINWTLPSTIVIENGTNPSNTTIGPGGAATMLDSFAVRVNTGTATISAVTVTLSAGSSGGLGLVEITNDAGSVVHGSVTNPATDTPNIALTLLNITATTTSTQYKARVTAKSHALMPAVPGAAYAVTGIITAATHTATNIGYNDANSATVTIDNGSPSNPAWGAIVVGNAQVLLNWTNPATDFSGVIILRKDVSAVTNTPVEGTAYTVPGTIGVDTIVYVGASTTFTDTAVTNGTAYYYKIFAYDAYKNYSANGSSTGPHTPQVTGDVIAPDAVIALSAASTYTRGFRLTWTAPGDDGATGTATLYDFRSADATDYPASMAAYLNANWATLTQAQGEPTPLVAGTAQSFNMSMDVTSIKMTPNTLYSISMKTMDEVLNASGISNMVSGHTAMKYGYNMISLPYDSATGGANTVTDIFNDDICPTCGATNYVSMYEWQPAGLDNPGGSFNGSWVSVNPANTVVSSIANGKGYYLYAYNMNNTVIDEKNSGGTPLVTDYTANWVGVNLGNAYGRHIIGSPYLKNANFSNIKVCRNATGFNPAALITGNPCTGTVAGTTFISFQQAADSGWVDATIFYHANSSTYNQEYCSTVLGCNAKLRAWWGELVYLLDNLNSYYIAIPKP